MNINVFEFSWLLLYKGVIDFTDIWERRVIISSEYIFFLKLHHLKHYLLSLNLMINPERMNKYFCSTNWYTSNYGYICSHTWTKIIRLTYYILLPFSPLLPMHLFLSRNSPYYTNIDITAKTVFTVYVDIIIWLQAILSNCVCTN